MPTPTKNERGQEGEEIAVRHLQANGYMVVVRNWRPGNSMRGEIDCIAWHGKTLCFVEVKTRSSNRQGAPQEAVTISKQRQISSLANAYVSYNKLHDTACRFDVVEVWTGEGAAEPKIALHQNAFDFITSSRQRGSRIF